MILSASLFYLSCTRSGETNVILNTNRRPLAGNSGQLNKQSAQSGSINFSVLEFCDSLSEPIHAFRKFYLYFKQQSDKSRQRYIILFYFPF
jgi:hypothetical protein